MRPCESARHPRRQAGPGRLPHAPQEGSLRRGPLLEQGEISQNKYVFLFSVAVKGKTLSQGEAGTGSSSLLGYKDNYHARNRLSCCTDAARMLHGCCTDAAALDGCSRPDRLPAAVAFRQATAWPVPAA